MTAEIFKQGAEGRLFIGEYKGERCLIKERFPKKYRHPDLDTQITRQRMKAEQKAIGRCQSAGILAPRILHMDLNERKIYMEYFSEAVTMKEYIRETVAAHGETSAKTKQLLQPLCQCVGSVIGRLHANNIIHGDLTSSNMLVNPINPIIKDSGTRESPFTKYEVVCIDFGLSHYSQSAEDKGVDLYVLERALMSSHSEQEYLFEYILDAYRAESADKAAEQTILTKFEEVRARGRKRTMVG